MGWSRGDVGRGAEHMGGVWDGWEHGSSEQLTTKRPGGWSESRQEASESGEDKKRGRSIAPGHGFRHLDFDSREAFKTLLMTQVNLKAHSFCRVRG